MEIKTLITIATIFTSFSCFAADSEGTAPCTARKIIDDTHYKGCHITRDGESVDYFSVTEYGCETFCDDECNKMGFSAEKYISLGEFFAKKKIPYTVIYVGSCPGEKEASSAYTKSWGGDVKVQDRIDIPNVGDYHSCSKMKDGRRAVFYRFNAGCHETRPQGRPEAAPATS